MPSEQAEFAMELDTEPPDGPRDQLVNQVTRVGLD
jgi:hypothetical protein